MDAVELAAKLLYAARTRGHLDPYITALAQKKSDELTSELKEPGSRKVFWINLYNGFVQYLINRDKPDISSLPSRIKFFSAKTLNVSGQLLSLNDIEHGMLRHSAVWWGFGYLSKWLVNDFEKKFRVPLDYRIHFALNCGAASCPAISFYDFEKLDEQLDEAMKLFLEEDLKFDKRSGTAYISPIFHWYRGDFGGKNGIVHLLWRHHLVPGNKNIRLRFKKYDWSLLAGKYTG